MNTKITVYDNGGETVDRYTVIVGNDVFAMSDNALMPDGYNQYMGAWAEFDFKNNPAIGKEIEYSSLSDEVKTAIQRRIEGGE